MSDQNKKTALVAGAGIAGLSSALFLDELGYDVTLIERKPILGGRTYSFRDRKTGLTIDNGQHLMIGAYHETIALLERLGTKHKIQVLKPTLVPLYSENFKLNTFKLGEGKPPLNLLSALFGFGAFSLFEKLKLLGFGRRLQSFLKSPDTIPQNITVQDWLTQSNQSASSIRNFWEILTLATLNDSAELTTADGLVQVMLKSYFGGREDGFLVLPKAGLSELFADPCEAYLSLRGHSVLKGIGIREVQILDNKVRNIILSDNSELKPDVFVSALPFKSLVNVLPRSFTANHDQLKHAPNYQSSPIISINLMFDRPVLKHKFVGTANADVHWFFDRNALELQSHAPQTNIHHVCGVISGAYKFEDHSKEQLVAIALKDLAKFSPESRDAKLLSSLVNKEREATLSSRVGVNATRPKQNILPNFYVVGDWTQTGLPATIESAAMSARLMRDRLAQNQNL